VRESACVCTSDIIYVLLCYIYLDLVIMLTLGVVGVERSMSETARQTSKGRKIGAWGICNARKARPVGPSQRAHFRGV